MVRSMPLRTQKHTDIFRDSACTATKSVSLADNCDPHISWFDSHYRLANTLARRAIEATTSWFSTYFQFVPFALGRVSPPPAIDIVHPLPWSGIPFKRQDLPLVVSEQPDILDPKYRLY